MAKIPNTIRLTDPDGNPIPRGLWVRDRGIVACNRGLVYGLANTPPPCACEGEKPGACCVDGQCSQLTPSACAIAGGVFVGGPCSPNPCSVPPLPCCSTSGRPCFRGGSAGSQRSISGQFSLSFLRTVGCLPSGQVSIGHSIDIQVGPTLAPVGGSCLFMESAKSVYATASSAGCNGVPFTWCLRYDVRIVHNIASRWLADIGVSYRLIIPPETCGASPNFTQGPRVVGADLGGNCGASSGFSGQWVTHPTNQTVTLTASSVSAQADEAYECSGSLRPLVIAKRRAGSVGSSGCSGCGGGKEARGGLL